MFKILKIGEIKPLSIKDLREIESKIDQFPVYQRYGKIWNLEKKKFLIDTIINGFDIPKFYFNYFTGENNVLNPNNFKYAVIDGKQRLEAIFEFLNNKFTLDKDIIYYNSPNIKLGSLNFSQISSKYPKIVPIIENYVLDIVYVITDEEEKLEELFLRLNGGSALTNAEKRNAIGGYLNKKVREITEKNIFFVKKVKFNNPRYQYQDLLTKLLYIELNGKLISLTNKALEEFLRKNKNKNDNIAKVINKTLENLEILNKIFEEKDSLLKSKGLIPVYYQFSKENIKNTTYKKLRQFFLQFEELRTVSKKSNKPDSILQEFDRLNQQGVHRETSLENRHLILGYYFKEFLRKNSLNKFIKIHGMTIEDDEDDNEN